MKQINVRVPLHFDEIRTADYLRYVAEQIEAGFTSGHVGPEHWWEYA